MAGRPWVTPDEVRAYTEIESVQNRTDARLVLDITRAEQYVITYTHNTFEDYDTIPDPVKAAVIILAEAYAWNAYIATREMKSESFDDYSYTAESSAISIDDLDLAALLDEYVISQANCSVTMRMRRL
ncbi:MAG: DUF3199 family protein [Clostridiales bacterium]|nr:DUF3199 family protein [Clostridiales bacterium]